MKSLRKLILPIVLGVALNANAQNPYLPLWEFIPDGEPYVFEDPDKPGEYRVYIYGSHDSLKEQYCGREQVVWSASVNDLSNWRYDGIIFKSQYDANGNLLFEDGKCDVLYAPDVTLRINADGSKIYYLYPNDQEAGRKTLIAKSNRPDGPFEVCNWSSTNPRETVGVLEFDPAAFVDDDGRVYGYWGFEESYGAELDPTTMATVKPGTKAIHNMISGRYQEGEFRFFEASSIRKIKDKYVFIYSRWTKPEEFGLPDTNYTLAYAYSENPLGPFTYGGTIIDGRARGVDESGKVIPTAVPTGNTHGSIVEINGKWWVFYHRQTGTNEFSRQAMVAPINVEVEEGHGGKVVISEGEYNSEGFATEGLNPLYKTPAGWACYLTATKAPVHDYPNNTFFGSYLKPVYLDLNSYDGPFNQKTYFMPVVNNTAGSTVGYKYFDFSKLAGADKVDLKFHIIPEGVDGTMTIMLGSPFKSKGGVVVGSLPFSKDAPRQMTEMVANLSGLAKFNGKQALFFLFESATKDKSLCELYDFQFVK